MQFLPNLADPRSTLGTPTLQFCWFYGVFLNILIMYTIVAFSFLLHPLGNFWCPFEGVLVPQRAALGLPGHPREHPGGIKINLGRPRGAPRPLEVTRGSPLSSRMLSKCLQILRKAPYRSARPHNTTQHDVSLQNTRRRGIFLSGIPLTRARVLLTPAVGGSPPP